MTSPPLQLAYARAPSKRWRYIRLAIVLLLAVAITCVVRVYGRVGWNRAVVWYWQDQCLHYSPPPSQVVYDEDPTRAAKLLAGDAQLVRFRLRQWQFDKMASISAAARVPDCWSNYCPWAGSDPVVFLHERRSPAGHRRLVCVYVVNDGRDPPVMIRVMTPSLLAQSPPPPPPPRMVMGGPVIRLDHPTIPSLLYPPRMRIYAGQVDPQDESRFTIRYEKWGQTDTIAGWLGDDDRVTIIRQRAPTPMPASKEDRAACEAAGRSDEQAQRLQF